MTNKEMQKLSKRGFDAFLDMGIEGLLEFGVLADEDIHQYIQFILDRDYPPQHRKEMQAEVRRMMKQNR